jgi:hypothetical protein
MIARIKNFFIARKLFIINKKNAVVTRITGCIKPAEQAYEAKMIQISHDKKERNRFWLLVVALILITDYLLICYHVDRSPLDIFPSIPEIDNRISVPVYVTDLEGKNLLKESRLVEKTDDKTELANLLVKFVLRGSDFENTKTAVPINGRIRKIWFYGDACVIDLRYETIKDNITVVPGSEDVFKKCITETITANIKGVKTVYVLNNGTPDKMIWDVSSL